MEQTNKRTNEQTKERTNERTHLVRDQVGESDERPETDGGVFGSRDQELSIGRESDGIDGAAVPQQHLRVRRRPVIQHALQDVVRLDVQLAQIRRRLDLLQLPRGQAPNSDVRIRETWQRSLWGESALQDEIRRSEGAMR